MYKYILGLVHVFLPATESNVSVLRLWCESICTILQFCSLFIIEKHAFFPLSHYGEKTLIRYAVMAQQSHRTKQVLMNIVPKYTQNYVKLFIKTIITK